MIESFRAACRSYTSEMTLDRDLARKEKTALKLAKVIFPDLAKTQKELSKFYRSSGQGSRSANAVYEVGESQTGPSTFGFLNSRGLLFKGTVSLDENPGQAIFGDPRPFALISHRGYAGHAVAATDDRGVPMDRLSRAPEHTTEFLDEVVTLLSQIVAVR